MWALIGRKAMLTLNPALPLSHGLEEMETVEVNWYPKADPGGPSSPPWEGRWPRVSARGRPRPFCAGGGATPVTPSSMTRHRFLAFKSTTSGDYVMAIEWFSRDPADSQRLTFMGDADDTPGSIQFEVVNSTELRAINLKMTAVRRPGASTRGGQQCPSGTP